MIKAIITNPENGQVIEMDIPSDMMFCKLEAKIREAEFVPARKEAYCFIYMNHKCSERRTPADYIPEGQKEIKLNLFSYEYVLI